MIPTPGTGTPPTTSASTPPPCSPARDEGRGAWAVGRGAKGDGGSTQRRRGRRGRAETKACCRVHGGFHPSTFTTRPSPHASAAPGRLDHLARRVDDDLGLVGRDGVAALVGD